MHTSNRIQRMITRLSVSTIIAVSLALLAVVIAFAEVKYLAVGGPPTPNAQGRGETWSYIDSYGNTIGQAKTETNVVYYFQSITLRSWSAVDYVHKLDEKYTSTSNGTLALAPGGVLYVSTGWVTSQHYWQAVSLPTNYKYWAYTSLTGRTSTSGCWDGTNCPAPW